jgi:hypothetical protein
LLVSFTALYLPSTEPLMLKVSTSSENTSLSTVVMNEVGAATTFMWVYGGQSSFAEAVPAVAPPMAAEARARKAMRVRALRSIGVLGGGVEGTARMLAPKTLRYVGIRPRSLPRDFAGAADRTRVGTACRPRLMLAGLTSCSVCCSASY